MVRLLLVAGFLAVPGRATAEPPITVAGGVVVGFPPALATGLARGAGGAFSVGRWGARFAYMSATESSQAWEVTHAELQVRVTGQIEHVAGRGRMGLRLGTGASLVRESRLRAQGMRAGLTGDELATSANALQPAAELEAVVALAISGPWHLALAGGPSVVLVDGEPRAAWIAQLGVGWRR